MQTPQRICLLFCFLFVVNCSITSHKKTHKVLQLISKEEERGRTKLSLNEKEKHFMKDRYEKHYYLWNNQNIRSETIQIIVGHHVNSECAITFEIS